MEEDKDELEELVSPYSILNETGCEIKITYEYHHHS